MKHCIIVVMKPRWLNPTFSQCLWNPEKLEEILPSRLYYYKIKLRHKIIHGLEGFENVKNKLVISTVLRWKDSNLTLYFNFK
jgi:hypothetical protein